jgi:hypothetical protein
MRHSIASERPVLDPSGDVMPVRGKMNFLGSRVTASESGGTTTVNVESVGSTQHLIQRFINNAGSIAQTGTTINVGSIDGSWQSFMDQGLTDLSAGYIVFAEAGLYHFTFEMYLTSGTVWPSTTTWPRLRLQQDKASGQTFDQDFTFRYHYPATSPYAYAHVSATDFMDAGDAWYFFKQNPATWATRSFTSKVLIARVA